MPKRRDASSDRRHGVTVGHRRYVLVRLVQVVPTALGVVLVGFLLIHLAPGDPVLALAGDSGDEAY